MGTRNLICIWYKGRFMVAQYCQWDGYLEGQGARILEFLLVPGNIERLKKGLTRITPVDDQTVQDILGKHRYSSFKNNKKVCECGSAVSLQEPQKCFPSTLDRDTGAKILDIIAAARSDDYIPIQLSLDFAANGLYCEFCYCVDLDAEVFEVFGDAVAIPTTTTGDEKIEQIGKNRFVEVCKAAEAPSLMRKSMPMLLKSWPLGQLPKDLDDMLAQVAADNVGESEYEDGEHEDSEDDVDDDAESEVDDDDAKEVVKDDDKEADTKDDDKKPQEDSAKKSDDEDKKTVVAVDDDAQEPAHDDKKAVIFDEYDPIMAYEKKTFKDEKERAEYEKRIADITEEIFMEAAQESLRRERERAAMQQATVASDKERTFTLSIRETK